MTDTVSRRSRVELSSADWRRLNRLLAEALDVEPDRRPEWIAALTDGDRALAPVLEDLLAKADESETDRQSNQLRPGSLHPRVPAPAEEQVGTQVGPYRLVRELGIGGMGTVWLAERTDGTFERQVALKLPRAEWTDRGLSQRMARERAVLASLNHPNIAQMYDAGWAGDGRPYLALEYVDGEPIDAWCRNHAAPPVERVRLFVDVVRAVAFAHAKLVIHRDLKPSNVLVDADGRVKLLDFGIAKLLESGQGQAAETELTQLSGRALTLNYAAPEQILGRPISTAADTYSLGVMLFELLTGERPYRLARDSRGALEEAIVSIDPPAPSSFASERATARALRGDLDKIVLEALRKQPEQRYETAAAFADDLERWLDQKPVRAQGSSGWYLANRFIARHRLGISAGAVATVAVLAGGGVGLLQSRTANEQAARAATVKELVLSIIAQADPVASRETRDADLKLLVTAEGRLARELDKNPSLALELRLAIAQAYRNRGEFARTRATLRSAIDEARKSLARDDLNLMRAWVRIADWQVIDDPEVMRELDAVIDRARQLGRRGALILVEGLTARAGLRDIRHGLVEEARADVREAYEVAVRHFGPGDPIALGVALEMRERGFLHSEALPVIEASHRFAEANPDLEPAHPKRLHIQSIYGLLLCETGRGVEGLELVRASERIARQHHGSSLPTEYALATLRLALLVTGDARGAQAAAREMLELASVREAPGTLNRLIRTQGLIDAAIASRSLAEARSLISEAETRTATLSEGGLLSATLARDKMWLMNLVGDTIGAERLGEQAVATAGALGQRQLARTAGLAWSYALRRNGHAFEAERLLAQMGDARPDDDYKEEFLSEAAAVQLAVGNAQAALELADVALAAFQRVRLQVDPTLADLHVIRGQALLALSRPVEARDDLRIADNFWRGYDADSHWAAEATYWLARALIEGGDATAGGGMLKLAQARLAKSPMPWHRALAASSTKSR